MHCSPGPSYSETCAESCTYCMKQWQCVIGSTKLHIQFMDEWWWNFALLLTYIKWIVLVDLYSKTVILVCLNTQNQCEIDDFAWKSCMCFFLMATLTITLTISLCSYTAIIFGKFVCFYVSVSNAVFVFVCQFYLCSSYLRCKRISWLSCSFKVLVSIPV